MGSRGVGGDEGRLVGDKKGNGGDVGRFVLQRSGISPPGSWMGGVLVLELETPSLVLVEEVLLDEEESNPHFWNTMIEDARMKPTAKAPKQYKTF
jgi:hypothetical protein